MSDQLSQIKRDFVIAILQGFKIELAVHYSNDTTVWQPLTPSEALYEASSRPSGLRIAPGQENKVKQMYVYFNFHPMLTTQATVRGARTDADTHRFEITDDGFIIGRKL